MRKCYLELSKMCCAVCVVVHKHNVTLTISNYLSLSPSIYLFQYEQKLLQRLSTAQGQGQDNRQECMVQDSTVQ